MVESKKFTEKAKINSFSTAEINLKHVGAKSKVSLHFEEAFKSSLTVNNLTEYYTYTRSFTVYYALYIGNTDQEILVSVKKGIFNFDSNN